ncbi:hypothetical protein SASPL_127474 [Salvia splendens]|uniref:F-box domain-containing protein n=1 Tax=Salvia splendens TaxID=180675 RepID=A0A8X8X9L1_SALSN|nr:hypothetical protein SASPL_127474 [Salvia splendens]
MGKKSKPPIPTVAAPWTELPDDLTANILQRLHTEEILMSAQKVCSNWWRVCKIPTMWRVIDVDYGRCTNRVQFGNICRCAVDRSEGQLVELKLSGVYVDGLLNYVAQRSSHLRRLTLLEYDTIPYNKEYDTLGFTKEIKDLPQLEELHLYLSHTLDRSTYVEAIGISCPMLKSFTYCCWFDSLEFSHFAEAIGKNMSNLQHLLVFVAHMNIKGLEWILDGCPRLESLVLPQRCALDLQGSLGKRCCHQIKDLWFHPNSFHFCRLPKYLKESIVFFYGSKAIYCKTRDPFPQDTILETILQQKSSKLVTFKY